MPTSEELMRQQMKEYQEKGRVDLAKYGYTPSTQAPSTGGSSGRGSSGSPSTTSSSTTSPATQLFEQVRADRPAPVTPPTIRERPGQTVDLSSLFAAIGQQPRQWQTPQPTTPQVFSLEQLRQAISQPLPAPAQPRFATPEQFGQWIAQFQQAQEPWLQALTEQAQAATNRLLGQLQSQWAARGLLASGAAAAQEREAATDLARQLAETRAQALANAVGQALQAGQLSLDEAAQLWQQAYQGRQADVESLLRALSQQEQMRQWEQAFGLDVERLRSQDWANWLDQLARAYQTEVGQQQWAQELGVQRAAQDFSRWLQTQQLNQQTQSDWLRNLLSAAGQAEEARQFNLQFPLQEAQLTGTYQGRPTLERLLQEAQLTGLLYGQPTLASRQFDWQRALQEAGLTGTYQGRPTWERIVQEAGLTGMYQGKPTWERQYQQQQLANARAKATSGGGGAGGGANLSSTEAKNLTRGTYADVIKKEIDAEWKKGGWAQAKKALADIEARIWQDAGELMKAGLTYNDIISLVNYARSLVGGIPAYSASGSYVEEP